ncbi:MAG TPA: carbohydrate ABC transporter permease [Acidimicrobiales bacterium]|nr:carbohydrate ABC transporter permease [Acidimicrobiales bacterium]
MSTAAAGMTALGAPASRATDRLAVAAASGRSRRRRRAAGLLGLRAGAVIFSLVVLFPVYWMVLTAFKPQSQILTPTPDFSPLGSTLAGFSDAIHKPFFWDYVANTVIVSVATVAISLAVGLLAALALARFNFRGRKLYLVVLLAIQAVPQTALVIPLFFTLQRFHQLNELSGLTATYVVFDLPFAIWLLRGFVLGVPRDIDDAARVDGCTRLGAFRRVLLPLIAPGMVATSIFAFIQAWNQYLYAYVFMQQNDRYTLTVWLQAFSTNRGTDYSGLMAGSVLYTLPVVLLFVLVQRKVVSGLAAGAVKG